MPLWGSEIYEKEMYLPIERAFKKYYSRGFVLIEPFVIRPYAETSDKPDIVFIRAYNQIHVVEAKRYVSDTSDAEYQLRCYRGNYKYLALPDGEYYNNEEYVDRLIRNRYGLILVGKTGKGKYAYFYWDSRKYHGDFSRYYEEYF